jgi:hypothetical protein
LCLIFEIEKVNTLTEVVSPRGTLTVFNIFRCYLRLSVSEQYFKGPFMSVFTSACLSFGGLMN